MHAFLISFFNQPTDDVVGWMVCVILFILILSGFIWSLYQSYYNQKHYISGTGIKITYRDTSPMLGENRIISWVFEENYGIPIKFYRLISVDYVRKPYQQHYNLYTFEYWEK